MSPIDIVNVLSAATPIVASITTAVKQNAEAEEKKNTPPTNINITINNHFYNNSESEALMKAAKLQNKIIEEVACSTPRFKL